MTDEEAYELGKRMQRIEKDIAEIKSALLGNVIDGNPGILGRVRERENVAEDHHLRIVRLETERSNYVVTKEFEELESQVKANTDWRMRVMWMIAGAAAAGAITGGGVVAFVMRLAGG